MNTYIVNEPSRNIRAVARQSLKGNAKPAVLAVVIYLVCITLPMLILDQLFGVSVYEYMDMEIYASDVSGDKISAVSGIYSLLVTGPFTLGLTIFFIDFVRTRKQDAGVVFAGFEHFFKTLGLTVVIGIFTLLWSVLFIIPGIIAALRYSQAFFILADDPNKGVMQCIRESKELMKGNKGKYFCLGLSFIGWMFLASFVIGIISGISAAITGTGLVVLVIEWVASLLMAGVVAYVFTAETVFYEMITGNLRPASDELPPLSQSDFDYMAPRTKNVSNMEVDDNKNSVNDIEIKF